MGRFEASGAGRRGWRSGNLGSWRPAARVGGASRRARRSPGVGAGAARGGGAWRPPWAGPACRTRREGSALEKSATTSIDVASRRGGTSGPRGGPRPRRLSGAVGRERRACERREEPSSTNGVKKWSVRSRQPTRAGAVVPPATGAHGRKANRSPSGVTRMRATRSEPARAPPTDVDDGRRGRWPLKPRVTRHWMSHVTRLDVRRAINVGVSVL